MSRWMNRLKCLSVLALALPLAACLPSATREAQRYYVLEAPAGSFQAAATRAATLLVAPTSAAGFYDGQGIVYSRAPGTRAYYQYASWTEPPGHMIGALLVSRLERSRAFRTVAATTSPVRGALVLTTHLEELYHEASTPPGRVHVRMSAEITDPARRELIGRRTFTQSASTSSYDAEGAVRAFGQALGTLLDEVTAWVEDVAPR